MRYATIYFCTAPPRREWQRLPLRRSIRRRYHAALAWLIRFASRNQKYSHLTHVAIEYDGVVLEPSLVRHRFWAALDYESNLDVHQVRNVVEVPVDRDLLLDMYEGGRIRSAIPSITRWLTGGRCRSRDCVSIAAEQIRYGGVDVPRNIYTPAQLYQHLIQKRFYEQWIANRRYARLDCGPNQDARPAS